VSKRPHPKSKNAKKRKSQPSQLQTRIERFVSVQINNKYYLVDIDNKPPDFIRRTNSCAEFVFNFGDSEFLR
jgi:hypothetical protein